MSKWKKDYLEGLKKRLFEEYGIKAFISEIRNDDSRLLGYTLELESGRHRLRIRLSNINEVIDLLDWLEAVLLSQEG